MAQKKYANLFTLSTLVDNIKNLFATKSDLNTGLSGKADKSHTHSISNVTNLQSTLDGKVPTTRTINNKPLSANITLSASDVGAAPSSVQTNLNTVSDTLNAHTGNSDIHFTAAERTKLSGIAAGAQVNTITGVKGNSESSYRTGNVNITKANIGLGNVDNTSDANKPISTAQQLAFDEVNDAIDTHTENTDIHVTTTNKSNWNAAYNHSQATHARTDATKVADSTTNGNILINGAETNVYSHPNSGVAAGTYKSVTVNAQGHVTGGSNPTTLAGFGITDAEAKGAASSAVSTHNTSTSAHGDIRSAITELTTKLNNFLDVDDTTTDQLSELLTLIENNATDIESITSGKVNVSDIVNNLTTNVTNKPLSAAQGVAIKALIDALQTTVNGKADSTHSHNNATTTSAGFMSADMVTKLNGIESGANKTVVDSDLDKDSTNPVQNKAVAETFSEFSKHVTNNFLGNERIVDNLTSGATNYALSAKQGKALKSYVDDLTASIDGLTASLDGKSDKDHTHNYLPISGGNVTGNITPNSAISKTIGSSSLPFTSLYAKNHEVFGAADKRYGSLTVPTMGTTSANGVCSLMLGNGTASGTEHNAYGRIMMYGTGNGYTKIVPGFNGNEAIEVRFPENAGTLVTNNDLSGYAKSTHNHSASNITSGILPIARGGTGNSYGYVRAGADEGTTIGALATAEGRKVEASGDYSHAEGNYTNATGSSSHAEGQSSTAGGSASHAEGNNTTASGSYSHSEGNFTNASSESAHAEGHYTLASSNYQHVQGKYNKEDKNNTYAHIVGNGTGASTSSRSNAHTLDWNGNAWYAGDIYVGGISQTDSDASKVITKADQKWNLIYDSGEIPEIVNSISGIDVSGYTNIQVLVRCYNDGDSVGSRNGSAIFTCENGKTYQFPVWTSMFSSSINTVSTMATFNLVDGWLVCPYASRAIADIDVFTETEGGTAGNFALTGSGMLKCTSPLSTLTISNLDQNSNYYFGMGSRVMVWGWNG